MRFSCCNSGTNGDPRTKHHHNPGANKARTALDHATGTDFVVDKSTTPQVYKRMKALGKAV